MKAFQRRNALSVDGIVGPKTWEALERAAGQGTEEKAAETDAAQESDASAPMDTGGGNSIGDGGGVTVRQEDWDALRRIIMKYESVG